MNKTKVVRVKSASILNHNKRKVEFIPSNGSQKRLEMMNDTERIKNVNNITRFGSAR